MRPWLKKIVLYAGMILLVFHFMLVFAYVLRPGTYSTFYAYPYFHQNWSLFTPPPSSNYNLYVTYNGKHTTDIFKEILIKHQSNRFGGSEALLVALGNTLHYFENSSNPSIDSESFKFIERFAKNYLASTRGVSINELKIMLVVRRTCPASTITYSN